MWEEWSWFYGEEIEVIRGLREINDGQIKKYNE